VHGSQLQQAIAARMPPLDALYRGIAGDRGASLATNIFGVASGVADFFSQFVIIMVLSIYLNADYNRFERLWLSILPSSERSRAREIWNGIDRGVGAYIRSEFTQSLLAGILLGLAYWIMGLQYPTLLAVLGALFWLIPLLGVILAVIPPFLIGLGLGLQSGIVAAVVTLAILGALEVFVEPRIFHRRRYSAILIALMMLALFDALGLIGLLIAPPLAAAIQIFFSSLLSPSAVEAPIDPITQITLLRQELSLVEAQVDEQEEAPPQVVSLKERLRGLIEKSEEAIKAEISAEN
jgi:predicted PurR-regulated permease PerM